MAYTAGSAAVSVVPDFSGWHRKIGDQLKKSDADFAKAGDRWGSDASKSFAAKFDPKATVKPNVEDTKAKAELDKLGKTRTPAVKPKVDDEAAKVSLRELARTRVAHIKVKVDNAGKVGESLAKAFGNLKWPALGAGVAALAPSALGAGLIGAGAGASLATAGAGIAAFAAIAVPEYQKVTKAQQALTTAQQQYAKATTKAGRASALKAEAAATDGLTSSEKRLATQLSNLQGSWHKVQAAQEPVVNAALTPWISTLTEGMKFLPSVVRPAASAIGALGKEAKTALQAPFWGKFFHTLGFSGETAITGFGDALGHMADGFAHLFVTFAPDINKLPGLINGWAISFDNWAKHYSRSGLDKFISKTFSPENSANLKSALKSLGTAFGNIATATANFSPTALTGLSNVLSVLAKLSPGQIEALGMIYGGAKVGQAAGNVAQGASGLLGLLGLGGKGKGKAEVPKGGKLTGLGKFGASSLGAILVVPAVASALQGTSSGPGGKNWWDNPFGMPGPNDKKSKNNWLTSWSPYENFFTKTLPGWAQTGWNAVSSFMTRPIPLPNWLTSWTPIGNFFTKTIPGWGKSAAHGLGNAWNASSGWVSTQFGRAKNWVTGKFKGAGNWLKSHGTSIAHGIGNGYAAASAWVGSVASRAKGWVTGKFKGAASWLKSHGNSIAHGIGNGYAAASGWVGRVAGRAKGWITGKFHGAVNWLHGTGNSIAHGIGNGYAAASGWVSGVARRAKGWVTGAFGGAGSWLVGIGRSIMSGLASGLNSAIGAVQSTLRWVTNHIPSWKGPPAYDRVLLRPAGQMIMSGFTDSLAAGIPGVKNVMGQVTNAAGLNVPAIRSSALPSVRGSDGIALTIGASGNDQLLQAIVRSLRADIRANGGGNVQQYLGNGRR